MKTRYMILIGLIDALLLVLFYGPIQWINSFILIFSDERIAWIQTNSNTHTYSVLIGSIALYTYAISVSMNFILYGGIPLVKFLAKKAESRIHLTYLKMRIFYLQLR